MPEVREFGALQEPASLKPPLCSLIENPARDASRISSPSTTDSFEVGDEVAYWSDTHNTWMEAAITKRNVDAAGVLLTYDLNVKRGALPNKIRLYKETESSKQNGNAKAFTKVLENPKNSVLGNNGYTPKQPSPSQAQDEDASNIIHKVGDSVEYWSATYDQWMLAVVKKVREGPDGLLYDLDVKGGAPASKIRLPTQIRQNSQNAIQAEPGLATRNVSSRLGGVQASLTPQAQAPNLRQLSGGAVADVASTGVSRGVGMPAAVGPSPLSGRGQGNRSHLPTAVESVDAGDRLQGNSRLQSGSPTGAFPNQVPQNSVSLSSVGGGAQVGGGAALRPAMSFSAAQPNNHEVSDAIPPNGAVTVKSGGAGYTSTQVAEKVVMQRHHLPANGVVAHTGAVNHLTAVGGGVKSSIAACAAGQRAAVPGVATMQARAGVSPITPATSSSGRGLDMGDITIGAGPFNPCDPSVKGQILDRCGFSRHAVIEEMQGFRGGLNEGVWFLSEASSGKQELVLKLVKCKRIADAVPTEAENCAKVQRDHPGIANDPCVAFPIIILGCFGSNREKRHDLIIMKKARGERLAELIAHKWYGNQVPQLMQILERLGRCLAEFHSRYSNSQHGDFQPSNIFYDEERDQIAFVDVGGIGVPTMDTDMEHFAKSMTLLADCYGEKLLNDGMRAFESGYKSIGRGIVNQQKAEVPTNGHVQCLYPLPQPLCTQ